MCDTGTENRTLALVPTDTGKFSYSYYGIPVFYAYGQNHSPILTVSYRNNTGIEPYTYQTMGAGHAGKAYISDYSGQLTVAKELFSLASTVNPFSTTWLEQWLLVLLVMLFLMGLMET